MNRNRIFSIIIVVLAILLGLGLYLSQTKPNSWLGRFPFVLGLDLNGGTELTYRADISKIAPEDIASSMNTLRDVIERRVNIFGVSEPLVQTEKASALAGNNEYRLNVELPGVTDIDRAIELIGQTPVLDFEFIEQQPVKIDITTKDGKKATVTPIGAAASSTVPTPVPTGLTGRFLQHATVEFNSQTNQPVVTLTFNSEGSDLFAKITRENIGKPLAIFLDGKIISAPVIREEISGGKAVISGNFTATEAKTLVRNLNYGALPVPIELVGTQTIGPSLGAIALKDGIKAGIVGFILVVLFLVLWYRLPGIIASGALIIYILISLALFKLIPVTFTAAGIAGFILSIGMAVDANILIFERMKEEIAAGRKMPEAIKEGFHRAWLSIRDSNISSIITAAVLFWIGTSAVKGFALTFGIGVLVSMFTAITVSRNFLYAISFIHESKVSHFLFGTGLKNARQSNSN